MKVLPFINEVNNVLDALVGIHFIALVIKLTKASLGHWFHFYICHIYKIFYNDFLDLGVTEMSHYSFDNYWYSGFYCENFISLYMNFEI